MYCCRKSTPKVISFYLILPLILFPFLLFPYSPRVTLLDSLPDREGKDYALFFAASNYQDQTLSTLKNAITDAERIAGLLKDHYGFEVEVVKDPTYELIEQKLYEYKALFEDKSWSSNSQLLIFFAGHGIRAYNNGFFLPVDADPKRLNRNSIPYSFWRPFISEIDCQHILLAVDACYSTTVDPDWGTRKTDPKFQRVGELSDAEMILANHLKHKARIFFSSDAKEDVVPGISNFARKFVEGLEGHKFEPGFITSSELFGRYIDKAIPAPKAGAFEADDANASFLFFPGFDAKEAEAARREKELKAWSAAQKVESILLYRAFLTQFPTSEFAFKAQTRLEHLQERKRKEEEKRLDRADWKVAKALNSLRAYQNYQLKHPDGQFYVQAKKAVKKLRESLKLLTPASDQLILVEGGTFKMGDAFGGGNIDEHPLHSVWVEDFLLGKSEVSNAEFALFLNDMTPKLKIAPSGHEVYLEGLVIYDLICGSRQGSCAPFYDRILYDKGKSAGEQFQVVAGYENHPVSLTTWFAPIFYANWLSELEGLAVCYEFRGDQVICNWEAKGYRLPTEAEWEYVASGGGQAIRYAWVSKKVVGNVADISYKKESPTSTKQLFSGLDDGFGTTAPVDTFEQGSLGFYNLSGNVWEWCWDWHSNTYYSTSKGDRNPKGPETGTHRVYRGGGWNWGPKITISYRAELNPSAKYNNLGFRLSRSVGGL